MKELQTTLLLIIKENKILLGQGKRGFSKGKFNGIGGKVEPNESIEEAMIRETMEEIGIIPLNFKQRATLYFDEYYKGEKALVITHLFVATDFRGQILESEEMKPFWFELNKIPFENMFPDDKIWLPVLLQGKSFDAYFVFDKEFNILSKDIKIK